MQHIQSAGIIIYRVDNHQIHYLLLHYQAGHWDFPKGKIETGETKHQAAARELQEETGLHADIDDTFEETISYMFLDQTNAKAAKTVHFFIGKTTNHHITLSHEHTGYQWLLFNEALEKLTYDNAKNLLKDANNYITEEKESL